jgi:capsular exopolysaccharide synthesis family protein
MTSLVKNDPFSLDEPSPGQHAPGATANREVNVLGLAWRSRWLILLMTIIGGGTAWAVLQRVTPCYTCQSRIYVERNLPSILDGELQASQSASFLYTQAEIIRSTQVLAKAAEDPDNANLETFRDVDNRVAFLKETLEVAVGSQDDIINVFAELPNAKDAAQIVNSVVTAYIDEYNAQRQNNAAEILAILNAEKATREKERNACRQALDDFRQKHAELAIQMDEGNVVTHRFAALATELNATEIELLQAKALFNRVKKMYDTPQQRPFLFDMAGSEQNALRDIELERQVQQADQALSTERARWGEGHPRVKMLRDSLSEMRDKLAKKQAAAIEAYVESVRQKYELLEQKRGELQEAYDNTFGSATEVSRLALEQKSLQEEYDRAAKDCDILTDRIKAVDLSDQKAGELAIHRLEFAAPTILPTFPSRAKFLGIGLFLGGLSGLGLAWLRQVMDQRLKSVDEISEVLQLSVLGTVPHSDSGGDRSRAGQMVALAPRSSVAEALRTLRTALHFGLAGQDVRIIAVTSPVPGDGKTTIASNLAIAMAQANQRVLLIDADLRKPSQHIIFNLSPEVGLASVLGDRRPLEEAIIHTDIPSLDVLPCGPLPSNPVELLNNGYFAEILEVLKARYDKIVIDSPPVMPVADARVIAAISEATLLVLRAERSTRRMGLGARNELWRVRATRLGVVLNGVPARKQGAYGYGDSYGYGYGGYGGYGDVDDETSNRSHKKSRALIAATPAVEAAEG